MCKQLVFTFHFCFLLKEFCFKVRSFVKVTVEQCLKVESREGLFVCLFIYGCVVSSLLHMGFL